MSENFPKSKLKRKKICVEDAQSDTCIRGTTKRTDPVLLSGTGTGTGYTDGSAAAWWSRPTPPAVESLWAFTLKSALPYLEKQLWEPVPDLPHPSAAKSTSPKLEDHRWCDAFSDVDPFPDTSPPCPASQRTSDPPSPAPPQQDLQVQTEPALRPPPSTRSWPSPDRQTAAPQHDLGKIQQREEEASSSSSAAPAPAGQTHVRGKQKEAMASVRGLLLDQRVKTSHCSGPPGEEKVPMTDGEHGGGGEDGGARIQRCPMCLQVFPAGFTQMDCDGHLAQCLSEMNVDMTW